MNTPERVGRWALGDIAERKHDRKLYRVVGFILHPAVAFAPLDDGPEMVQVAGCPNELNELVCYTPSPNDTLGADQTNKSPAGA